MGRHVALVIVERAAQALAVDQQGVAFAAHGARHVVAHIVLVGRALEDAPVELLLELLRQRRPVAAHRFQALVDHLLAAVGLAHQARVAFLAAFFRAADGGHQEAPVMRLEFQLQRILEAEFLAQVPLPPGVHVRHQGAADGARFFIRMRRLQPHEGGIRVAIDDLVALFRDQLARAVHDVVAAQGDRRGQARVEKAAAAGPQHAIKRVHDDL